MYKKTELENQIESVVPSGNEVLSILLQQDGLSFAVTDKGKIRMKKIVLSGGDPGELRRVLSSEWNGAEFSRVWVCVPTDRTVLIPAEMYRPEQAETIMGASGIVTGGSDDRILAASLPPDKILLHAVREKTAEAFEERFGATVSFFHPLFANLSSAADTLLQVDVAGGYAAYTLTTTDQCLFCDVLPGTDTDDILFQISRIIDSAKIGNCRIVCSGEQAEPLSEALSRHFSNMEFHPDRENRNLLFPFRCE